MENIMKKLMVIGIASLALMCGNVKNVDVTETGALVTFEDNTGYYFGK